MKVGCLHQQFVEALLPSDMVTSQNWACLHQQTYHLVDTQDVFFTTLDNLHSCTSKTFTNNWEH